MTVLMFKFFNCPTNPGSLNGISLQEIKSKSEETGPFIITSM